MFKRGRVDATALEVQYAVLISIQCRITPKNLKRRSEEEKNE
jgi:hypothetical protein